MTATAPTLSAPRSQRAMLTLLAAVFFLPVLVASGLFWLDWRPTTLAHHGELLRPARPLPETGLQDRDGRPLPTAELRGKWLLVLPENANCKARCQAILQEMEQVHRALGKEQSRVRRVFIAEPATQHGLLVADIGRRFPDMAIATIDANGNAWRVALAGGDGSFFIVDPLGNVMMRYGQESERRGVLKDLERLLKYTWLR